MTYMMVQNQRYVLYHSFIYCAHLIQVLFSLLPLHIFVTYHTHFVFNYM